MAVVLEMLRLQNKLVVTTSHCKKTLKNAQAIYNSFSVLNNLTFIVYLKQDNTKQKNQEFLCAICSEGCILQNSYEEDKAEW